MIIRVLRILFSTSLSSFAPVHTPFPCLRAHILVTLRNSLHIHHLPDVSTPARPSILFRTDAHTLSLPHRASAACAAFVTPGLREPTTYPARASYLSLLTALRGLTLYLHTADREGLYTSIRPLDPHQLFIRTTQPHTLAHTHSPISAPFPSARISKKPGPHRHCTSSQPASASPRRHAADFASGSRQLYPRTARALTRDAACPAFCHLASHT